jgi:hypothetical protein
VEPETFRPFFHVTFAYEIGKNQKHAEMKKSIILFSVILFKLSCSTFSQAKEDTGRTRAGFQMGISHMDLKEQSLNRATHNGPGIMGGLHLERSNTRSIKMLNMELGSNFLRSRYEGETSSYRISGSASFSYLRNIIHEAPPWNFHLGGKVKAFSAIEYFDNWDESHFYWITSYSFGADLRLTYSFGDNSIIQLEADFPLFSLVSRPPAKFSDTQSSPALRDVLRDLNRDLRILSPEAYRNFTIQLSYSLRSPKKFVPAIFWRFNDMYINKDGSGQLKSRGHTLGLKFRF